MQGQFKRIGIFSKPKGEKIGDTLLKLCNFLEERQLEVVIDEITKANLNRQGLHKPYKEVSSSKIGQECDLILVVGGDGSFLKAARAIVDSQTPIVGINSGNLGFLADVKPNDLQNSLDKILAGEYLAEQRTMLCIEIKQKQRLIATHLALNEVVLHHGDIARLIEFEIYVNDLFLIDQRADGLIVSTPTGSTAYALSGGGPIVYPTLNVLTLVPMFPHTLSNRPIVLDENSKIRLVIEPNEQVQAKISYDGQTHISLNSGDEVHISRHKHKLTLLHPRDYDYYAVLREKLGWNNHLC